MQRRISPILTILLVFVGLLVSCAPPQLTPIGKTTPLALGTSVPTGSLGVTLAEDADRTTQARVSDIDHLTVTVTPTGTPLRNLTLTKQQLTAGTATASFNALPVGTVSVAVTVYDINSTIIGSQTHNSASITANVTTQVTMTIKLNPTYVTRLISTVAGMTVPLPGTLATRWGVSSPCGVTMDSSGNTYVACNNSVYKVTAATGIITTFAGDGTAGFSGDNGAATDAHLNRASAVAMDASGNLYIADVDNHRIRKVAAATGIITTVAGNGSNDFSGDYGAATSAHLNVPMGIAVDASGNLYIADMGNQRIRKVAAATGIITTVAGNGTYGFSGDGGVAISAQFSSPWAVAVDASGNLYIADLNNQRIRKVAAATGIITTVAGNGTYGFSGDGAAATSAQIYNPQGVAVDGTGNLYIADGNNHRICKVAAATGIITTVAGNGSYGFSGDSGAATSAQLGYPEGVAVDVSGNLYIADTGNHRIRKVSASTRIITTIAGNGSFGFSGNNVAATSTQLSNCSGVAVDASGNLYIADLNNHRIRKVAAATGIITTVAGNGSYGSSGDSGAATSAMLIPYGVAVDGSGNLYIADGGQRIRKVVAATGIITTVAGNGTYGFSGDGGAATSAKLNSAQGVAVDANNNLYIADLNNHRIRKVAAATGIITTVAGNGSYGSSGDSGAATSAQLYNPQGVAVDASGNLYIADSANYRIRKVAAATGIITTVAGNGSYGSSGDNGAATSAQLFYPQGVAVDGTGNLYIADSANHRIRKVPAATGIITTVAGNGTQGFSGDGAAAASAQVCAPQGVAIGLNGALFIADTGNQRIRKVY